MTKIACAICVDLDDAARDRLDAFLADPARWPLTIWGLLGKPRRMTPAARRWGAIEVGVNWLEANGHAEFTKIEVAKHYRDHVPLVETTLVRYAEAASGRDLADLSGTNALLDFYEKGIKLGLRSFEIITHRIDVMEASGDPVPMELLSNLAAMGAKMATSAATLSRRNPLELPPTGNSGFRRGVPSKRMGHSRIREIDGVAQPVHDEGPADREDYAARARLEGQNALT